VEESFIYHANKNPKWRSAF